MTMKLAPALGLLAALFITPAIAAETMTPEVEHEITEGRHPAKLDWSFNGVFGTYDRASLQRGFQVYKEVCSACHSLNLVSFHSLSEGEGGSGFFTDPEVKAIAAAYKVPAGPNDKGETTDANGTPLTRPGIPSDHFPAPFANEQAARTSNNGALPPDLSLMAKAREGGPDYIHAILTGFGEKAPAGFHVLEGKYFNPYFPGGNISMPPPLTANQVTYSDGTKATVDQMAKDVSTFLMWTAEPKLEERHHLGLGVMAFLLLLSVLLFLSYKKLWKDVH
jgi:ubiquinol-cytochrome c reductase cytochrome c1 subunit